MLVLESDWFVAQEAHATDGPTFHAHEGNALIRFVAALTHSVSSVPMGPRSVDRYVETGEELAERDSDGRYGQR
jgi:hypothetical protein